MPAYRQLASSRSSTPPARFGRATDAAGPAHHGLGSSPIGVPIGDAIRRIRWRTPCMVEEDHFELICETFERTVEATSD